MMYAKNDFDLIISLGQELKRMYEKANRNEQVAMIHVFAIKNGKTIIENNIKSVDIIKAAGLQESYKTEISKGVKLSNYVELQKDVKLP